MYLLTFDLLEATGEASEEEDFCSIGVGATLSAIGDGATELMIIEQMTLHSE